MEKATICQQARAQKVTEFTPQQREQRGQRLTDISFSPCCRVGNRTSDAHYNPTPLLGIWVRHLSDNATGLKDRYHSRWVSIFIGVPPSLSTWHGGRFSTSRFRTRDKPTNTGKSKMGRRFRWRLVKLMFGEKIISRSTTSL